MNSFLMFLAETTELTGWDNFINFLRGVWEDGGLVLALGITFSVLFSSFRKIWRYALVFRKDIVTTEELNAFKKAIRADLRYYKEEISDIVIKSTFKLIDEKLSIVEEFKKSFVDLEKVKIQIDHKFEEMQKMESRIDVLSDNMKSLNNRMENMSKTKEKSVKRDIDKR